MADETTHGDDLFDQATMIAKNFSTKINESFVSDELKKKALVEAAFWTHRANPGSTDWLIGALDDAKKYIEKDREFIVQEKLEGWERYV